MTELELKFCIPPERLKQVRAAVKAAGGQPARRTHLVANYFDTPTRLLAAHRIALRLRKEGRQWVQTLKADGGNAVLRLEHNVVVRAEGVGPVPALDLARHHGTEGGERALQALGTEAGALALRYSTDVWRQTFEQTTETGRVEVALDEGRIAAGERSLALSEIEFELKAGSPSAMFDVALEWSQRHGLWLSTVPKSAHGDRLAEGQASGAPVRAKPARLGRHQAGAQVLRSVVGECLEQVLGNASEVASGSFDEEHVHQLRVGIRRLRTVLRDLAGLAHGLDAGWEAPLVEAFRALGDYRDNDTIARAMAPRLEAAGAPTVVWPERTAAGALSPAEAVRVPAFQAMLLGVLRFVVIPAEAGEGLAPDAVRKFVRQGLKKLHRQVVGDGGRFTRLEESAQHRVRKRLKRLRYLAEFAGTLFDEKRLARYLKRLRPAQDALGEHNDELVALANYRTAALADPAAWFAVGWLQSQQVLSARDCRQALRRLGKARRFWR
jgi:inorganic triphosphatase YgiF